MKTSYRDILNLFEEAPYKETLKAIFSFETDIKDENKLNKLSQVQTPV